MTSDCSDNRLLGSNLSSATLGKMFNFSEPWFLYL